MVIDLTANVIGALGAVTFAGFLAYKIGAPPLIVIVVVALCLMIYSFYDDMRKDRAKRVRR